MKHRHRFLGYFIILLILIILAAVYFFVPGVKEYFSDYSNPSLLRDKLLSIGPFGWILFFILLVLSIVLPIPSTPVALAGGYVYGTVLGTILSLSATVVGSLISFYLVRKFGEPLLRKLVDAHHLHQFNHIFQKRGLVAAYVSYSLPIFPSDTVSLILGLTKIRYSTFLLILIVGHIPRFLILNSLGNDVYFGFNLQTIIIGGLALFLALVALFRKQVKHFLFRELKELKLELTFVEEHFGLKKDHPLHKKKLKMIT